MMPAIEGSIMEMRRTSYDELPGIELRVFIPEPNRPGIVDQAFFESEEEFKDAEERHNSEVKKYQAVTTNMNSLCLEDVSLFPHREMPGGAL
jgi:hypothetical protein